MFPDRETTSYLFRVPKTDWDDWKRRVPRDVPLYQRIHTLLQQDTRARATGDTDEVVCYSFLVDPDLWRDWLDVMDHTETYHERIQSLLAEDIRASYAAGWDDMDERTARLIGDRVKHRSNTAINALENGNVEKAREELEEINTLAEQFDE
jgi:hypothetical protein